MLNKAGANLLNTIKKAAKNLRMQLVIMSERQKTDLKCIINTTRNVLLSAQMGERASVVLICIITSRYNEVK